MGDRTSFNFECYEFFKKKARQRFKCEFQREEFLSWIAIQILEGKVYKGRLSSWVICDYWREKIGRTDSANYEAMKDLFSTYDITEMPEQSDSSDFLKELADSEFVKRAQKSLSWQDNIILNLRLEGRSQVEIAELANVSPSMVSLITKKIFKKIKPIIETQDEQKLVLRGDGTYEFI